MRGVIHVASSKFIIISLLKLYEFINSIFQRKQTEIFMEVGYTIKRKEVGFQEKKKQICFHILKLQRFL